jgi:hypothetical protein
VGASGNRAGRSASRAAGVVAGAALLATVAAAGAQSQPQIGSQGGSQTLELAPQVPTRQRNQSPQGAPSENARVIPVIPPNAQVLTLPQASTDFLGKWGGRLQLVRNYGRSRPPSESIMSLVFGQRDGRVVLATTVVGSPSLEVLRTHAATDGPRTVKLEVTGVDIATRPPLRQVQKVSLTLIANDRVKCSKLVDIYVTGVSDPLAEALYEGTLHTLTRAEDRMLTEQLIRQGAVPRYRIEQGNPPPE